MDAALEWVHLQLLSNAHSYQLLQMQLLLWIEELQHEVDILTYNMTNVPLELKSGGLVALKVGLS